MGAGNSKRTVVPQLTGNKKRTNNGEPSVSFLFDQLAKVKQRYEPVTRPMKSTTPAARERLDLRRRSDENLAPECDRSASHGRAPSDAGWWPEHRKRRSDSRRLEIPIRRSLPG